MRTTVQDGLKKLKRINSLSNDERPICASKSLNSLNDPIVCQRPKKMPTIAKSQNMLNLN